MDGIIIKHIHIEGIWGKYTVDLPLNDDVNILVGNNGVGKTTILVIVCSILMNQYHDKLVCSKYQRASLSLNKDIKVEVSTDDNGNKTATWYKENSIINYNDIEFGAIAISNFDTNPISDEARTRLEANNKDLRTELDLKVCEWLEDYYRYKSGISNAVQKLMAENKFEEAGKQYALLNLMKELLNNLFRNKIWFEDEKDNKVKFILKEDDSVLNCTDLSSGEKQLLIMFISTLIQKNQNYIVFWDEPEISLHIGWQQQLINTMRQLNPNMQMLIATHSPALLYGGWEQRALNVKKTISKAE